MKNVELRLVAELIRNSRRNDRDLAWDYWSFSAYDQRYELAIHRKGK